LDMWVYCAKTAEPIEIPFEADSCESKELCVRWGQDRRHPFADVVATLPHPCTDEVKFVVEESIVDYYT